MQEVKVGTYTGTGAAVSVMVGFQPDFIEAMNKSELWKWQTPLSSGAAIGFRGATGSMLCIESKGFAVLVAADKPSAQGFRAHSSVSQSGNTYYYRAMRNG